MTYVTFVLQELFGYDEEKATKLMLQVHHEGKAIVSSGPAGADGARHEPAARLRAVGQLPAGFMTYVSEPRPGADPTVAGAEGVKPFRRRGGASSPGSTRPRPASSACCSTSSSSCWPPTPTTSRGDPVLARLLPDGTPRRSRGSPRTTASSPSPRCAAARPTTSPIVRATLPDGRGRGAARPPTRPGRGCAARNDLRLALGTRLDITEDTEPPDEVADEEDQQLAVYYWLTALQGSLVDALAAGRAGRR